MITYGMRAINSISKLANTLGAAAREIAETNGDLNAQLAIYGLFLDALNGTCDNQDWTSTLSYQHTIVQTKCLLDNVHLQSIFADQPDPAIYFYEDFLRAYDPSVSKGRGVHYSPPEAVSYILRGIKSILEDDFPGEQAVILDPCCGVGTFLKQIPEIGLRHKRIIGMELSRPACEIASRLVPGCEILNTDSLADPEMDFGEGPLAIIGNPPYSGHSSNAGAISDLMADYRQGLTERNPKWLQDDYVKFIRMAQHRIEKSGRGIIAFITNHSYLFNPTFKAMRASLMHSFDKVFTLNLYGNALANPETDEPDENIFKIRMGVAIVFMVKILREPRCTLFYSELQGSRKKKLAALASSTIKTTPWQDVTPAIPFITFTPSDHAIQQEFYGFASLFDIFREHSVGFVTSRDSFAIDTDREALIRRISDLRNPDIPESEIRSKYAVTDLDIAKARAILLEDDNWQERVTQVLYRPFDKRWAYYSKAIMERPRLPFMDNLMHGNLALAIGRAGQVVGSQVWDVVFCTDCPADLNLFRRGGAMLFPLNTGFTCNLVQHEAEFFYYIYAILHSSIYRKRYSQPLSIDYPRIPFTDNQALKTRLIDLGKQLVKTHLMRTEPPQAQSSEPFKIGGWDIPGKYLTDRKHSDLTDDEILHLEKIRGWVLEIVKIQIEIDEYIITAWN